MGDRATGCCGDRLAGRDARPTARQAEWRRGDLPPGALGDRLLADVLEDVEPLVAAAAEYRVGEAADRDVDVELPDGTRVVGTVGGLYGHTALRVEYSRLAPKQRLRSWVRLVALTAATDEPWRAVTVGRGERFGIARAHRRAGRRRTRPAAVLAELVALRAAGLCAPLPLTTRHRLQLRPGPARRSGTRPRRWPRRRRAWTNGAGGERADPSHERVWGRAAPASVLVRRGRAAGRGAAPGSARSRWGSGQPLLQVEDVVRR